MAVESPAVGRLVQLISPGDDPCMGVHLRQLLRLEADALPSLTLDSWDGVSVRQWCAQTMLGFGQARHGGTIKNTETNQPWGTPLMDKYPWVFL